MERKTVERGCGLKPNMTPALVRKTVREVKKNPRITTKDFLVNLGSAGGHISRQRHSINQTLHTAGFKGSRPRRTPLLLIRRTNAHLAFANVHLDKEDFWPSVLWSNETKTELSGHNVVSLIWCKKRRSLQP